ncbi:hypothetical protein R1sor_006614 [Riccia sorocarpa]|uniref:Uncharacterized protein n=1 Tax=Riccia sorocarpa TaxID=122646 RepID=A0ABD3HNG1_9MARC
MGWFSTIFLVLFSAVTTIGGLRRVGWISVHPERVEGAGLRRAFEAAIQAGDFIVAKGLFTGAIIIKKSFEIYEAAKGRQGRRAVD